MLDTVGHWDWPFTSGSSLTLESCDLFPPDSKWIILGPRLCSEWFEHSMSHYSQDWIWCKPRYPKVSLTLSFFEEQSRAAAHKQGSSETGVNKGGGKCASEFPSLGHSWTIIQLNICECLRQHDPSWLLDPWIFYLSKAEWPEAASQVYSWEERVQSSLLVPDPYTMFSLAEVQRNLGEKLRAWDFRDWIPLLHLLLHLRSRSPLTMASEWTGQSWIIGEVLTGTRFVSSSWTWILRRLGRIYTWKGRALLRVGLRNWRANL